MIGEKIKKLREERKMSITQLANQAGVAKSYLSSIERNIQFNPSIQFIEKICRVFNIPTNDLIKSNRTVEEEELDDEWVQIVREAMESGVSKEQFKRFLEKNKYN